MDYLYEYFVKTGFKDQDIMLLLLCPIFSVIGGFIHSIMIRADFSTIPGRSNGKVTFSAVLERLGWLVSRLLLSAVIGLVFGFYLVGSLSESYVTVSKILAFSILLGYAAPRLWASQEKIINEIVEERLRKILKDGSSPESKRDK